MKYATILFVCLSFCTSNTQHNENVSKEIQNSNLPIQTNQATNIAETKVTAEKIISDIPKASWENIYFEEINERIVEAGLKSLRKTNLEKNDLEVRVWMGFGITKLEGFVLRRSNNSWSAIYMTADYKSGKFVNKQ